MAEDKEVSETKQGLSLVCSAEIVYSNPGDDVVLSCHLEPAISAVSMEIKWRNRADLICHYKDRQMTEIRGYDGRVSLSLQDLPNGEVSLTLRDISTSQKGLYICEVIHEGQTLKEYIILHVSSDFSLVIPSHTVSAYPGADVILPVHLSPATSAVFMTIRWYRDSELIYQYIIGQEIINVNYENRVGLSIQELRIGNLSLTLRNVQVSDSGDYTCKVLHDGCLQTGIIHLQVREFQKSENTLDLEDLHNALKHMMTIDDLLRRTYDEETRVPEETIKQFRKTLDQVGKDKKRKKKLLLEEDETTVDRNLREEKRMQIIFLPSFGVTHKEGLHPRSFTPRHTNSMEGLPPWRDNSTLERHEMEERNAQLGHVHSRLYAGENESNMESESSSQNTRQTREGITGTELFPESVISPARDMTQAQDNPGATMQSSQGGRLANTVTVQGSHSPAVQEQARTSQSVTSQARGRTQTQERPGDRTQRRQESKKSNCLIL